MSASWPTSIASDSTLYIAVNELQNNLSGAINSAVTTVGLNSTTSFPTVGLVLIDNEVIKYTGVSGNNLTGCTRGFDGTTAASHSSAAVVSFAFCAAHHNGLKDEVIAIETSLNLTASRALSSDVNGRVAVATTTLAELNFVNGVTSAIQTQLNAKAPTAGPTFSGTIGTALTGTRVVTTDVSGNLATGAATMGGALAMGANKVTGLANGTAAQDAVAFGQLPAAGQLPGTATNDNASAGNVGEFVSSTVNIGSRISSGSSGVWTNITSISLTAGDWDVTGIIAFTINGATVTGWQGGVSIFSGNTTTDHSSGYNVSDTMGTSQVIMAIPRFRVSVSGTTTVYAKENVIFSGGTPQIWGGITARRMR